MDAGEKRTQEYPYRTLTLEDFSGPLLTPFIRRQEVRRCWRQSGGGWILKEAAFLEDWDAKQKQRVAADLRDTVLSGGAVTGCFDPHRLIGFGAVRLPLFGSGNEYLQLSQLQVSGPFRGRGVGGQLFRMLAGEAKRLGARKLYISAHSAEETQSFYRHMGCADAQETDQALAALEPFDRPLEFVLE